MKNRPIIALLTVIAVLLGANLIVTAAGTTWAQDRQPERVPVRPQERPQERPQTPQERPQRPATPQERPQRPQTPPDRGERPVRPGAPAFQREPRCVGITSVGNVVVLAFDDGTIETRSVPQPR